MTRHIGRQCFFCGVSTVQGPRRRAQRPISSYLLTEDFMTNRPYLIEYAHHLFDDRQITVQDRICRPCIQRADRFVTKQKRAHEEEAAASASQRAATDDVLQPSSSHHHQPTHFPTAVTQASFLSSIQLQRDPLRVTPQEPRPPLEKDSIAQVKVEMQQDLLLSVTMENEQDNIASVKEEMQEDFLFSVTMENEQDNMAPVKEEMQEDFLLSGSMAKEQYNIAPVQVDAPVKVEIPKKPIVPVIPIPGFSRIPFSSTNCIKAGCSKRQNLHRINVALRTNILVKQNIFIQNGVRVCEEHLKDEALWADLAVNGRPTIGTFNGTQIANMLKMLQKRKP